MKLFISYSRDDKNYVYELAQALKDRSQHDVWIDRRLVAADLWWDTILDNIEACECFVVVLTPKCVSSIYCNAELDYALALQKPILPLMLKPCDMPAPLRKIQTPDISGASLSDALLICTQALYEVRIRRMEGKYPAPDRAAGRPTVPIPPASSEQVSDVYADAEESAAEGNESLAEKLFNDVIAADPQGFGLVATERLADLRQERKRAQEYNSITRLMANPNTLKGAKNAWKVYVQTFGTDYDPNGYANKLASQDRPIVVPQSVVVSKLPIAHTASPSSTEKVDIQDSDASSERVPAQPTPRNKYLIAGIGIVIFGIVAMVALQSKVSVNTTSTPSSAIKTIVEPSMSPTLQPNNNLLMTFDNGNRVYSVAFAPYSKTILTGTADNSAQLWDIQSSKILRTFSGHSAAVYSVAFSPDGKTILTGSGDNTAQLWDVQSGQVLQRFTAHTAAVWSVAFSPDGKSVLTGSWDNTAVMWDVKFGIQSQSFNGHIAVVYSVAFSPDGKSILTGSGDGTAKLWSVQNGTVLRTFAGHTDRVESVAFAPDGRSVLTGSDDHTAKLWDVQSGTVLQIFTGHSDSVSSVAFSPNGKYVLTGSHDHTAKLWDVQSGKMLQTFSGHTDYVTSVAFSPDGKYILTGSWDKTAKLWASGTGQ